MKVGCFDLYNLPIPGRKANMLIKLVNPVPHFEKIRSDNFELRPLPRSFNSAGIGSAFAGDSSGVGCFNLYNLPIPGRKANMLIKLVNPVPHFAVSDFLRAVKRFAI
jgi:hypothetical protein